MLIYSYIKHKTAFLSFNGGFYYLYPKTKSRKVPAFSSFYLIFKISTNVSNSFEFNKFCKLEVEGVLYFH